MEDSVVVETASLIPSIVGYALIHCSKGYCNDFP